VVTTFFRRTGGKTKTSTCTSGILSDLLGGGVLTCTRDAGRPAA
jgi:hypothetical protein